MPKKTKDPSRSTRTLDESLPAPGPASSSRLHETLGIVTLAVVLLVGPSLLSVQFGHGTLMGPIGKVVGSTLNRWLGLGGYLLILGLLLAALRIFAGGLGLIRKENAPCAIWRQRAGLVLGLGSASLLMHLCARPHRLNGASFGGLLGETGAELLCSLVSSPGAWVLALTGLSLALVLTTRLSLARLGLWIGRGAVTLVNRIREALRVLVDDFRAGLLTLVATLRRRAMQPEVNSDGAAALPPVVRLDLGGSRPEANPKGQACDRHAAQVPLPQDLEIGGGREPDPLLDGPREAGSEPRPLSPVPPPVLDPDAPVAGDSADPRSPEAASSTDPPSVEEEAAAAEPSVEEAKALTIVEARFRKTLPAPEEEEPSDREVSPTDGPGFVLKGSTYRPPPLSLLEFDEENAAGRVDKEAIYKQADRLVKTLSDYKIVGRITEVHPGPVVTMYEFVPAPGTRISKVANLANDLAMSLAAQKVRIVAPIPGKGAIGIEVPNEARETVYFKEIVANEAFRKGKARLALAMGKNIFGAPSVMDLSKMPHLLVAGATGAGKSVSINTMICSLLMKNTPEEVRLIMVDPKFLELSGYNDIPHLLLPVVTDPKQANIALRWAVSEMERRYQLLADMRVRDIASYNRKVDKIRAKADGHPEPAASGEPAEPASEPSTSAPFQHTSEVRLAEAAPSKVLVVRRNEDGSEEPLLVPGAAVMEPSSVGAGAEGTPGLESAPDAPIEQDAGAAMSDDSSLGRRLRPDEPLPRHLPYIVVIIDEFADLMMVASKEVETSVARLAQKARAAGIHVILATQRPSVDVITGLIKANFPSRVSFQVASTHDSKTILGCHGAEHLLGNGDMLVLDRGADMKRLHGAYISDREIQRIVEWLRDQGRPVYDMDILKPKDDEDLDGGDEGDDLHDEMYDQAVALVAETRLASISMIQRRLRVGYNRAARMVERMEREGIVGPADGVRGREVYVQHHE